MTSVLFDFNGTLSDDEWVLCDIFRELFAEAGRPMSEDDYYGLLGYSDPEIVEVWLGRPDPGIVQRKIDEYRRRVSDGSTIDEETRLAVRLAAEHGPVAVVSGSARDEIEPVLDAAGLLDVVVAVVPREDVANGKPAPDGYLRALELLNVDSGVAIEDSPPGIVSAKAAGLRCVGLTRWFTSDGLPGADLYTSAVDRELIRRLVSSGVISLDELRADVESGAIDTVVVAFTDMQGRLMGKRMHGGVLPRGLGRATASRAATTCSRSRWRWIPVPGYEIASWERGYGDFRLEPDLATLRRIPWLEATALVLCDVALGGRLARRAVAAPGAEGPGRACARRPATTPMFGSELEFYLLKETYAEAHAKHYRDLTPSVPYILDYHVLATTYDEPFIRQIRNGMQGAGIKVESSKGEAWPGQHEINFRFADAVTMADNHVVYKNGAKEIAHLNGCSITFMAKPDHTWIGNSCHIHGSLWRGGEPSFTDERALRLVARGLDRAREGARGLPRAERQLVQALRGGLVGADDARVGERQPDVRLPGRRPRAGAARRDAHPRRRREPVPRVRRADRGRARTGSSTALEPPPALEGNAYESDAERFPSTLREAIAALEDGTIARGAFGDDVVDHYLNYARTEQRLFDQVVTCYERERFFERG